MTATLDGTERARTGWPASVPHAIDDIAAGRTVVVIDDTDLEDTGDLVLAAGAVTARTVGFLIRHTSGVLCAPMPPDEVERLRLAPAVAGATDSARTISVNASTGITTGHSATDRTRTLRTLADPQQGPTGLSTPGHIFPLRTADRGVLQRTGRAEAAVDLVNLSGTHPIAATAEAVDDSGEPRSGTDLRAFVQRHGLTTVSITEILEYRRRTEPQLRRAAHARLPTAHGTFHAIGYEDADGGEHLALVRGDVTGRADVAVHVHTECVLGDVFGTRHHDCGRHLDDALRDAAASERAVVVYLRGHHAHGTTSLGTCATPPTSTNATTAEILDNLEVLWTVPAVTDSRE